MSTKLIVHEIEAMGFWVEIEESELKFMKTRYFLYSDGSLDYGVSISPMLVVRYGLFKDKKSAVMAANQYGGIEARKRGEWSVTVTFNLIGRAA